MKYKLLAGGGMLKIVNRTVPMALTKLGYNDQQVADVVKYIDVNDMIEEVAAPAGKLSRGVRLRVQAREGRRSINTWRTSR